MTNAAYRLSKVTLGCTETIKRAFEYGSGVNNFIKDLDSVSIFKAARFGNVLYRKKPVMTYASALAFFPFFQRMVMLFGNR